MVAPAFVKETLLVVLNNVNLHGHRFEQVPLKPTLTALIEEHGMRKELAEAVLLRWFGSLASEAECVELDMSGMVRFLGLQLLESRAKESAMVTEDFVREWEMIAGPNLIAWIKLDLLKVCMGRLRPLQGGKS